MELDNRKEKILKSLIDEYIETADPVSSAGLISKYPLNISSATVRNEMLELEKMGYLEKPYSSSGRVPSKMGYRYYVDKLILDEKLSSSDLKLIRKNLGQKVINLEELTKITTATISEITHYTSIAITSKDIKEVITSVEFIRIGLDTIMVLIITDKGRVKETIIKFDKELSDDVLTDLRKLFSKKIIGKPLEVIPKSIEEYIKEEVKIGIEIISKIIEEINKVILQNMIYIEGATESFKLPELSDDEVKHEYLNILNNIDEIDKYLEDEQLRKNNS
ncbi:MAG: heat-inducible transcription repressor HrcA [Clostridiales bacterium]|jgi:heat-inducible transcription repressor hrcA|nr:heat-inducible transcription repressor HrcA [Clostridiales bacterium]